jgi:hypothetical protein
MNIPLLKHAREVRKLAILVTNRSTYNRPMYAIDVNNWGISEPFSDPENDTIYRFTLRELINDTYMSDGE